MHSVVIILISQDMESLVIIQIIQVVESLAIICSCHMVSTIPRSYFILHCTILIYCSILDFKM